MKKGLPGKLFYSTACFLLIILVVSSWSCRKEDQTCKATITVTDGAGAALSGATIHLRPNATDSTHTISVDETKTTDGAGQATFEFKLQAILNCTVTSGSLTGTGIVKLEPAKTVEKTIIAKP